MSNTAVAKTDNGWRGQLRAMDGEFGVALPAHITAEKFRRAAETAVMKTPALLDCDRKSLFQSLMQCAETGLMPDGKHAALVPYQGLVQFQPMVFGLLSLMRNSDEVLDITVDFIGENDAYEVERGMNPRIFHKPTLKGRGEIIASYAILKTKDGGVYSEIMDQEALHKVRNCSQSYRGAERKGRKDSPWHLWEGEFSIKSVVKRLSKRSPTSNDRLIKAVDYDNLDYRPELASAPMRIAPTQSQIASAKLRGEPLPDDDDQDIDEKAPDSPVDEPQDVTDVEAEDTGGGDPEAPEPEDGLDAAQDVGPKSKGAAEVGVNRPGASDDEPELLPDAVFESAHDAMDDIAKHIRDCKTDNTEDLLERYDGWKALVIGSFKQPKEVDMAGRKLVNQKRLEIEKGMKK